MLQSISAAKKISETCRKHCLEILHCTWQLKDKITDCDWTIYSCSQSEKKIFSLWYFDNSQQQQMHTTNMHKTFYRHLKPSAVTCNSFPCPPICSRAETNMDGQEGLCLPRAVSRRLPVCSACHGVLLLPQ